jgi:hypothetical protein
MRTNRRWPWLFISLPVLAVIIVATWVGSVWVISHAGIPPKDKVADLATILFGAASVALFLFSILVAVGAVIGWQVLQGGIEGRVERITEEKLRLLHAEMSGRIFSGQGFMIGELSWNRSAFKPTDLDRLAHGIELCRMGYTTLKKVGGGVETMGLNNLVFYLCLQGDEADRGFLLENARKLRRIGHEQNLAYLLLTYCSVVARYGSTPEEVREAVEVASHLANSPIPEYQRKEAKLYLDLFEQRRPAKV